jgi:hypothetical protein
MTWQLPVINLRIWIGGRLANPSTLEGERASFRQRDGDFLKEGLLEK